MPVKMRYPLDQMPTSDDYVHEGDMYLVDEPDAGFTYSVIGFSYSPEEYIPYLPEDLDDEEMEAWADCLRQVDMNTRKRLQAAYWFCAEFSTEFLENNKLKHLLQAKG